MELDLAILLRLLWTAGILPIVLASLPCSCLRRFRGIISTASKRGKTPPSSPARFTVPHSFFAHFYVLGFLWTTCLLGSTWNLACKKTETNSSIESSFDLWKTVFLLLLMDMQVLRRLYESFFVFKYDSAARMHVLGYFTGLIYYVMEPISLCCSFASEALIYSGNQISEGISEREFHVWDCFKPLAKLGFCQWTGAVIFFWGWIHQLRCHKILGSLRKKRRANDYIIPRGDWFEVSSSAHYLAEIVIYIGILLASGGSDATVWLILAFVVVNLVFAAGETHRWYLQKFEDYPRSRRAIIPLVY